MELSLSCDIHSIYQDMHGAAFSQRHPQISMLSDLSLPSDVQSPFLLLNRPDQQKLIFTLTYMRHLSTLFHIQLTRAFPLHN
jgi:hypothetical protein